MYFLDPVEGLSPLLVVSPEPALFSASCPPRAGQPQDLPPTPSSASLSAGIHLGRVDALTGPLLVPVWSAAAWAIPDFSPGPRPEGPTCVAGPEQQPLPPLPPQPPWHYSGQAAFFSLPLAQGTVTRCLFSTRQACPRAPGPQVKSDKICSVAGPSQPGGRSFPRST